MKDPIGSAPDLADLIERLRQAKFRVGTSEAIDATALLFALAPRVDSEAGVDSRWLCRRLRPIFCKSADEQHRFDPIFSAWWGTRSLASTPATATLPPAVSPENSTAGHVPTDEPPPPPRNVLWIRIAIVASVLIAVAGSFLVFNTATSDRRPPTTAQATPAIPSNPAPRLPSPPIAEPPKPQPADEEFVPVVRRTIEIRPWWVWTLGALPIIALLSLSVPVLVLSRTRLKRRSEPMYLDPAPLEKDARRLVPPLTAEIGDRLARHVRSSGVDIERLARRPLLDVRRTIEATVRNRGIPTLRFSVSRVHPSYLMLIDVANERDPRGRLFYQWAERLNREGLDVELLLMRRVTSVDGADAVRVCEAAAAHRGPVQWQAQRSLRQIRDPRFGERLIVISDGDLFADGSGRWAQAAVTARFHRWRDRAMFTPLEPRDWGTREESLERAERANDPGFVVLPLEESALAAWTDLVLTGQLSTVMLTDPQRFPAVLRRNRQRFLRDEAPPPDQIERLVTQLRLYLGDRGFYWLAAIAATPVVRWELTMLIGKEALGRLPRLDHEKSLNASLARNYRRLVRLPWLQQERMPNWLRLRLLVELTPAEQDQLRDVVSALLGRLSPHGVADGIELSFERPPGSPPPAGVSSRGAPAPRSDDPIYLGYMSGLPADQLVLRAPREWTSWASKIPLRREPGLRGWFSGAGARLRAQWSRWMWTGGMPHLGWNPQRLGAVALLMVPLFVGLVAASRVTSASGPRNWFFSEGLHRRSITAPALTSVALSKDGSLAATVEDGVIRLWDPVSGKQVGETIHVGDVRRAIFTPDSKRMIFSAMTSSGYVAWLDFPNKVTTLAAIDDGAYGPMAFSADGSKVLVSNDRGLVVLDVTSAPAKRLFEFKGKPVAAATFVQGTANVDVGVIFDDGAIATIDLKAGKLENVKDAVKFITGPKVIAAIVGEDVAVARQPDGSLIVFNEASTPLGDPLLPPGSHVRELAFSGDGRRIAAAMEDGAIHFWAAEPKAEAARFAETGTIDDDAHHTLETAYTTLVEAVRSPSNRWLWTIGVIIALVLALIANSTRVKRLVVTATIRG